MTPNLPVDDLSKSRLPNAKPSSQVEFLAGIGRLKGPDLYDLRRRELCSGMQFARPSIEPTFGDSILTVVPLASKEKVSGRVISDATRIVTSVAYDVVRIHRQRVEAMSNGPRHSVRKKHVPTISTGGDAPVAALVTSPCPNPTRPEVWPVLRDRAVLVHASPKADRDGRTLCIAHTELYPKTMNTYRDDTAVIGFRVGYEAAANEMRATIALLNSMVLCGESHSERSTAAVAKAMGR